MFIFDKSNNNLKLKTMTTTINQFNEEMTKWTSHKHPDNPNFQQVVHWYVWVKEDGKTLVAYKLGYNGKTYFIYNLTKQEAIEKFTD